MPQKDMRPVYHTGAPSCRFAGKNLACSDMPAFYNFFGAWKGFTSNVAERRGTTRKREGTGAVMMLESRF